MPTPISSVRIDPATGSLVFAELNLQVPFLTRWKAFPGVLKQAICGAERPCMGWTSHHIGRFWFEGHEVVLTFSFLHLELKSVYFGLIEDEPVSEAGGSDRYSPEAQRILQEAFESQLGIKLVKGGFTDLVWGNVVCDMHPKDGVLVAGIHHRSV